MRTDSSLRGEPLRDRSQKAAAATTRTCSSAPHVRASATLFACGMCVPNGGCCDLAIKESGWYHYWPHGISVLTPR